MGIRTAGCGMDWSRLCRGGVKWVKSDKYEF